MIFSPVDLNKSLFAFAQKEAVNIYVLMRDRMNNIHVGTPLLEFDVCVEGLNLAEHLLYESLNVENDATAATFFDKSKELIAELKKYIEEESECGVTKHLLYLVLSEVADFLDQYNGYSEVRDQLFEIMES